jgi:hypothetical protein
MSVIKWLGREGPHPHSGHLAGAAIYLKNQTNWGDIKGCVSPRCFTIKCANDRGYELRCGDENCPR